MKSFFLSLLILLGVFPAQTNLVFKQLTPEWNLLPQTPVVQYVQEVSYTVSSGRGAGSGVVIVRNGDCYVWTAAHVVSSMRRVSSIVDSTTGKSKLVVSFLPVSIVKEIKNSGQTVGTTEYIADVVKYSDSERGQDLAILKVRQKHITNANTTFYLENNVTPIGTDLYHVGSYFGIMGANSLSTGILSQYGKMFTGTYFDQTSCTAFPGSSGGGVFLKDGRYIGMLVRSAGPNFNLIVPIRRMREWAYKVGLEWALDPSLPVKPTGLIEELDDSPLVGGSLDKAESSESKNTPITPDKPSSKDPQLLPF